MTTSATASNPAAPAADEAGQARRDLDLMIRGFQLSSMLRAVADFSVADAVAEDRAIPIDALAAACGVLPQPLLRILRALAGFGIFAVSPDGLIAHSPRSLLLRRDAPQSLHHAARFWAAPGAWASWGALGEALTGGSPHQAALGTSRFAYLAEHPQEARLFDAFMAHAPDDRHQAIADACDIEGAPLIVDLGGGNGEALRRILARAPAARGLVFDLPHVVAAVPPEARLGGRIACEAGSFFETVPEGADIYLLNWVLHDWSDADCLRILAACRAAMASEARLLIAEHLLEPDPALGPAGSYLLDAHMMVMLGARERSQAEFGALLAASGFAMRRTIRTASSVCLIEAAPR